MIWLYTLLILGFFIYHFVLYNYAAYIFSHNQRKLLYGTICGAINLIFWIVYLRYFSIAYEVMAMMAALLIMIIEFKLIFKVKNMFALFLALSFAINLFAKRFIAFTIVALIEGETIIEANRSLEIKMLVAAVIFTMSVGTISIARKSIKRVYLDTILSDDHNMGFLTGVYLLLYITMVIFSVTTSSTDGGLHFVYQFLLSGLFALGGFVGFLLYAYNLAALRLVYFDYEKLTSQNMEQLDLIKKLEEESLTDDLTKMQTRVVFDEALAMKVRQEEEFFVTFIDIDGLKYVNDTYGHNEGDFYIRQISRVVNNIFYGDLICRYGGDEILILGNYSSDASISSKLVNCYNEITNIKQKHDKPYYTSVSYGTVFIEKNNVLTEEQIIALADKRMYEFKKQSRKERSSTRIN